MNAFFVAAEFALVKVRVTQLDRQLKKGDRRAHAAKAILQRLDRYLSVTQFGITVASLGLGWLGEPAFAALVNGVWTAVTGSPLGHTGHIAMDIAALGVLTFLHLLIGELVPKFIAIQHSVPTVLVAALPLRAVNLVFRPVLWVLEKAQRVVLRMLRIDPDKANEGTLSEDELIGILAAAASRDEKGSDKQRIIERILRFASRPIRQMEVPRVDMVVLPVTSTGEEAYEALRRHSFSRIPLIRGSLDEVVGYLYAKDITLEPEARERKSLVGLERRVLFFPESRDGLSALREMQRSQIPLAIVVDEYGGTSGMVTIEDLVEEIVGEIRDELDVEPVRVAAVPGEANTWEVDATATALDLRDAGADVEERWEGEPLGGIVLEQLGHLPRVGDVVRLADGVIAEVIETSRRRIQRLRVRVAPQPT